jgi:hypothetical protein
MNSPQPAGRRGRRVEILIPIAKEKKRPAAVSSKLTNNQWGGGDPDMFGSTGYDDGGISNQQSRPALA